jgi:hypothetical protein
VSFCVSLVSLRSTFCLPKQDSSSHSLYCFFLQLNHAPLPKFLFSSPLSWKPVSIKVSCLEILFAFLPILTFSLVGKVRLQKRFIRVSISQCCLPAPLGGDFFFFFRKLLRSDESTIYSTSQPRARTRRQSVLPR